MTLQPSPRERARRRGASWGGAIAILVALLLSFAAPVLRPVGAALGVPLYAAARWAGSVAAPVGDYFSSKSELAEENRQLHDSVSQLTAAAIERDSLLRERDELRAAAGLAAKAKRSVVAEIIARPPATAFDTLLVQRASLADVREGDVAFADGAAVGVVTRVDQSSAAVTLLSAPGSTLAVSLNGQAASAIGRGEGRFEVDLPAQLAPATGTPVTAFDGAPLAVVSAVVAGESEATVRALLTSPVDLAAVRYVTLGK